MQSKRFSQWNSRRNSRRNSRWLSVGFAVAILCNGLSGLSSSTANANTRTEASSTTNTHQTQPLAATASGVRVTYLYASGDANGATTATTFKAFLDANGYTVTPVAIAADGSASLNAAGTDLFMVAADTAANGDAWLGSADLGNQILATNKPVFGLGAGGRAFLARTSSALGNAPQTRTGTTVQVTDFPTSRFAYQAPNALSVGPTTDVQLYAANVEVVAIPLNNTIPDGDRYGQLQEAQRLFLPMVQRGGAAVAEGGPNGPQPGRILSTSGLFPLLRDGRFLLWGFAGDSAAMTDTGHKLFLNLLSIQSQALNVNLQARSFTPGAGIDANVAPALAASAAGLHVYVQMDHVPSPAEHEILKAKGLTLLESIIGHTYVAFAGKGLNTGDPALVGLVRWMGLIPGTDKMPPNVAAGTFDSYADNGDGTVNLNVTVFADVPTNTMPSPIAGLIAGFTSVFTLTSDATAQVRLPKTAITPLSQNDAVQWIDQVVPAFIPLPANDVARTDLNVDAAQQFQDIGGTAYYGGLSGRGINIAVMDAGVFSSTKTSHVDLPASRMLRNQFDTNADTSGARGHGTHVAGIIGGSGQNSTTACPFASCTNFQMRGMAPEVKIAAYGTTGPNASTFDEAINTYHIAASNHSYVMTTGEYNNTARDVDLLVRGDLTNGGTSIPARVWVNAAANQGTSAQYDNEEGYYSMYAPAKNALVVGSLNPNTNLALRASSSRGPTFDGRIKPDVMAIGCERSLDIHTDGYVSKCGTSMASPATTGIVALMIQQYRQTFATTGNPLPSTFKAVLINTATDLTGPATFNDPDLCPGIVTFNPTCAPLAFPGPDFATGYGAVNAKRAVDAVAAQNFVEDAVSPGTPTRNYTFTVGAQQRMTFTLAWDDEAGNPAAAQTAGKLVNDLDLVVIDPNGNQFFPWTLAPLPATANIGDGSTDPITQTDLVAATTGTDRRNNVEQVVVNGSLTPGVWTVRVNAFNLPNGNAQKFSLAGDFRVLRIVDPVEGAAANAGDPTNPDKLLVKLWAGSTVHTGNVSLAGAQATDFSVNISKAGYSANASVVSGLPVGDQFWLVVQPQAPGTAGYYSMTVTWNGFGSAFERRSVLFLEKIPVDRAVVIDQSGSMSDYGKMEAAKNGARLYVDQTNTDDAISVVAFESSATVPYPIQINTSGSSVLNDAKNTINGLTPLGATAMGQGLNKGQDQLEALGRAEPEWRMVLLSDGMENVPPYWADPAVKGRIQPSRTIVDTVAVGPSSAGLHSLLAQIAADTGGRSYHVAESGPAPLMSAMSATTADATADPAATTEIFAPSAAEGTTAFDTFPQTLQNKLADIYKTISEDSLRHQRVFEFRSNLSANTECEKTREWTLNVEKDVPQVIFAVNWADPGADLRLLISTPGGAMIAHNGNDIVNEHDATHDSWRIFKPEPGDWKILMRAPKCKTGTEYMLFQSIRTQLTLLAQTGGDIREYCVGRPIPILGILADTKGMIHDEQADVFVDVLGPTREENALGLPLYDDGAHADGAKLNGIYANWFTNARIPGVYTAKVYATGKSNFGEPFTRRRLITFVVRPCVAYVLRNDTAAALGYETLLESHGMSVDLIPTVAATGTDFSKYQLVVIGADTGVGSGPNATWFGGPTAVKTLAKVAVPVIGNGVGGGAFFQALGLDITWAKSWVNSNAEVVGAMNPLDAVWNKTYSVTLSASGQVQLYQKPATSLEVFGAPGVNIKPFAYNPTAKDHFPIAQQAATVPTTGGQILRPYVLWGFYDAPARMTAEGRQTYVNLAWYLRK